MVLMHGIKRVFDTPNSETSNSGSVRTASIYGITSYNDIVNNIIPIKSNALGIAAATTLNINNLGALDIKYFKNGVKSPIDISNWVGVNQIYYVYYDGIDFVLLLNGNNAAPQVEKYYISTDVAALTNSSTAQQIKTAFTNGTETSLDFIDSVTSGLAIIMSDNTNYVFVNYSLVFNSQVLENIILEFIYENVFYKQTYTLVSDDLDSVVVETSDLLLRNANNTPY